MPLALEAQGRVMARNRKRSQPVKREVIGTLALGYFLLFVGYLFCLILYRGDTWMFAKHGAFVCVHMFVIGVKRHNLRNFNGFDLLFGCFYLYFWWEEPLGFMLSYFYWALSAAWLFKKVPLWDNG